MNTVKLLGARFLRLFLAVVLMLGLSGAFGAQAQDQAQPGSKIRTSQSDKTSTPRQLAPPKLLPRKPRPRKSPK